MNTMTPAPRRRSSLFVLETAAAVLIFSLACVLCVQLFVRAHTTSRDSRDTMRAVTLAQNAAELFIANDDTQAFCDALGLVPRADGTLTAVLTPDLLPAQGEGGYLLSVSLSGDGGLRRAQIHVLRTEGDAPLFTLETAAYTPPAIQEAAHE